MKIHSAHPQKICTSSPVESSVCRPGTAATAKAFKKQRGFDLIQLGLVVALIGLLMSGALVGVPKLIDNIRTNQQTEDIRSFMANAQASFALHNPAEITAAAINSMDLYPSTLTAKEAVLTTTSRFGTPLTITRAAGATDRQLVISLSAPNANVCSRVASELGDLSKITKIATIKINRVAATGRINRGEITTRCAAAVVAGDGIAIEFTNAI